MKFCECGCGQEIEEFTKHRVGELRRFKHGHNLSKDGFKLKSGSEHPAWKGGKYMKSGYVMVYKPDHPHPNHQGYVREHRLIYEEYYKCCILPWIHVNHKNGIRIDNRIENLELLTSSQHAKLHFPASYLLSNCKPID